MANYPEMFSVSLTENQAKALQAQARVEHRSISQTIRVAVCDYLVRKGKLPETESVEGDEE